MGGKVDLRGCWVVENVRIGAEGIIAALFEARHLASVVEECRENRTLGISKIDER
jgi:hypothetical protein